jgi:putative spermidine/putrescine transport system substrate-binding protein
VRSPYRFAFAGVAAAVLLATGCSSSSSSNSSSGSSVNWANQTTASAGGGMSALVAAAKKEGTLNVIALPPTWANYGTIISTFEKQYGITVNSALPDGTSQQEVNAVKSENGTAKAPDVLDVGLAVALANTSLFAPYQVSTWSNIPAAQKDPSGLWYEDYGGYMAVGYSAKFGTITSLSDLLSPKFKNAVALNGNPTSANAALNGVMMASLAQGGSAADIGPGVSFFGKLKAAGNFSPISATGATIKAGTTPVVFNWDYLNLPSYVGVPSSQWKVFIPPNAVLGGYYAQAINKNAPHPAAARLWEEFLYSQAATGGQNLWLQGGARPVEEQAMTSAGTLNTTAAAALPAVTGTPVFLTQSQNTDAANYLAANWAKAVS